MSPQASAWSRPRAVPGWRLVLTRSLLSLREAEREAGHWEQRIRPPIVHNVRRAEQQEARGLFAAEITVHCRFVAGAGS